MYRSLLLGCMALVLAGCASRNLYLAHHTVIGVNGALNTEKQSGHVIVGYDREFSAVVPKSVDDTDGREVMATIVCSKVVVDGLFLTQFSESVATGNAALNGTATQVMHSNGCKSADAQSEEK